MGERKPTGAQRRWARKYGPWAVVTGASNGIGREIAVRLAQRGSNVVLAARSEAPLQTLARDLERDFACRTRIVAGDLSGEDGQAALFAATSDLDVGLLVANAGFGSSGDFIDQSIANELNMIDLNCRSVAAQAHHFANRFRARRRSGLIILSSIVAWQGAPGAANYAATKAYAQSLAEGLYFELRPHGVDVLAVAPAQVETGFNARAGMAGPGAKAGDVAENALRSLGRTRTTQAHLESRFLSSALALLPRGARIRILSGVMRGLAKAGAAAR